MLIGGQQFLRTQNAQHIRQVAADLVLPALAAIQCEQQRVHAVASRLQRQHSAVFIIGMCHDLHQSASRAQAQEFKMQTRGASILRNFRRNALISQTGGRGNDVIDSHFSLRRSVGRICHRLRTCGLGLQQPS